MKSRKLIQQLFTDGIGISIPPLKLLYRSEAGSPAVLQAGVTVSSRNFKKAVQRNRVKRIVREAYRLQKPVIAELPEEKSLSLHLFFIYTGRELAEFHEVYEKMGKLLVKLAQRLNASTAEA